MQDARGRGRSALNEWRESQPKNFFDNHHLESVLRRHWSKAQWQAHRPTLEHYGLVSAGPLDEAAIINNRVHNLPMLERYSDLGDRIESIEHHGYHAVAKRSTRMESDRRVQRRRTQPSAQALSISRATLEKLAITAPSPVPQASLKAARPREPRASSGLSPGLLTHHYVDRLDGAQFLTEVQGGSDVGANCVEARPDGEAMGTTRWKIFGEKWFCSNADADLILMTARVQDGPDGRRGLGLVATHPARSHAEQLMMRRLKDKLGTRSCPRLK